eukprot:1189467-Prorocentrum_minimum.AAC.2
MTNQRQKPGLFRLKIPGAFICTLRVHLQPSSIRVSYMNDDGYTTPGGSRERCSMHIAGTGRHRTG